MLATRYPKHDLVTVASAWRMRLAQDGALLSTLSRLFVDTVHSSYAKRAAVVGGVLASAANSGILRYLAKLGEPIDVPTRSTSRGPPYWKSTVLRRKAWA